MEEITPFRRKNTEQKQSIAENVLKALDRIQGCLNLFNGAFSSQVYGNIVATMAKIDNHVIASELLDKPAKYGQFSPTAQIAHIFADHLVQNVRQVAFSSGNPKEIDIFDGLIIALREIE